MEVFDHLEFINEARVSDIQWLIAASTYAKTDNKGRKSIDTTLREMAAIQVRPGQDSALSLRSAYDEMPDEARVLSVGSCLTNEGMGYLDRRPYHREWLAEKGISPEDARLRYTEWRAEKDAAKEKRRSGDSDPVGGDD
jgi:hypothetical protein